MAGETSAESAVENLESSSVQLQNQTRGGDTMQATVTPGNVLGGDMMKLFNDAQQNMLYLNKQRLMAVDELHKSEREREFLLSRVTQLEAEMRAELAQREVLEQKLHNTEAELEFAKAETIAKIESPSVPEYVPPESPKAVAPPVPPPEMFSPTFSPRNVAKGKTDPPPVWSMLLLRIDAMRLERVISITQAQALRELVVNRDARLAEIFEEVEDKDDVELVGSLIGLLDGSKRKGMHVVQVCTEFAPLAQAGSLAPWISGLCRALRRKGHLVEVILPKYASLDTSSLIDFREVKGEFVSFFGGEMHQNKVWTGAVYGLPITLIEPLHPSGFFSRNKIYGFEDDFERFSYFCRAALEWLQMTGKTPDVLHLHNWHTAVVAPLFWDVFWHQGLTNTRLLLTCHNFKYQSSVEPGKLALCGLDPGQLHRQDRLQDNLDPSRANILKGGIVYSNKVTTVSSRYASDVKNSAHGLETTLSNHEHKFVGVPSGVDDTEWDPSNDPFLPALYSVNDLSGKATAKLQLRQQLGLPLDDSSSGFERPLVGCLAPLVSEKELEIIKAAMERTINCGGQFVAVGASKNPRIQAQLEELRRERMDDNTELIINYDDKLAHTIVAASDILVCPDTADPVGRFPFVALKYGALPVVRQQPPEDSIVDPNYNSRGRQEGNGFVYSSNNVSDMAATLQRAIDLKKSDPDGWAQLVQNAMTADFSWDAMGSDAYIEAYRSIQRC